MLIMDTQIENMMKHYRLTLLSLVLLFNVNAFALQSDLQQEVIISAKNQQADIKNNQMIFNGPVKVTQGSITITAQTLRAFSTADDEHKILVAIGAPATYSQKMDNGLMASASAKEIRYDLNTRVLQLTGDAILEQSGNKVTSNAITYDILQQKLTAQSGSKGKDRVTTVIKMDSVQHNTLASVATTTKANDKKKDNKPTKKASPLSISPISQNKLNQPPADQSGWYIQVGAFAKQSSVNNAIKKITNSGFDYIVFPDMIREQTVSRILVGPYQSLKSAKKDIKKVQFEIEKNAYFYHIK